MTQESRSEFERLLQQIEDARAREAYYRTLGNITYFALAIALLVWISPPVLAWAGVL